MHKKEVTYNTSNRFYGLSRGDMFSYRKHIEKIKLLSVPYVSH